MPDWKIEVISPRDGTISHVEVKAPTAEVARQAVALTGAGVVGAATLIRLDADPVVVTAARPDDQPERELADLRPSVLLMVPPVFGLCAWSSLTYLLIAMVPGPMEALLALVAGCMAFWSIVRVLDCAMYIHRTRLVLTSQRVIARGGTLFTTKRMESPLRSVETIGTANTLWGSVLGLWTVGVSFNGGTRTQIRGVAEAPVVVEKLNRAIEQQRRR
ncbi:MAG: PH domain-containing protein [Phycisphaerales bacterium]|nr:PH domain-containing protein [Phycisphaeraceae bacterium]